eukprot:m.57726 g.57726  ORF g.57726 m.57726 type:complete len:206 (-) comp13480_c0_seq1:322-939(-)
MGKPVIAVDLDEVLGCFTQALVEFHNKHYGTHLKVTDFHTYRFADTWGGTEEESRAKVDAFLTSEFFENLEPVQGAHEGLQWLKEKADLVIVTSRHLSVEETTHAWINRHFPNTFKEIHFGNHWAQTGVKKSKSEMCLALGARALIDDSPAYAVECAAHLPVVLLFGNYSWNQCRDDSLPKGVVRVHSWPSVTSVLEDLWPSITM